MSLLVTMVNNQMSYYSPILLLDFVILQFIPKSRQYRLTQGSALQQVYLNHPQEVRRSTGWTMRKGGMGGRKMRLSLDSGQNSQRDSFLEGTI